jgi:hypothetical protein
METPHRAPAAGETPPPPGADSGKITEESRWLDSLSEPELVRDAPSSSPFLPLPFIFINFDGGVQDLLISLKMLAVKRAETASHPHLADAFDLRTLRALGTAIAPPHQIFLFSSIDRNWHGMMICSPQVEPEENLCKCCAGRMIRFSYLPMVVHP